jgi:hypothetical protein
MLVFYDHVGPPEKIHLRPLMELTAESERILDIKSSHGLEEAVEVDTAKINNL